MKQEPIQPDQPEGIGVTVRKPRTNVYTMMLILSLMAIIMACVLLCFELNDYGGFSKNFMSWWKTDGLVHLVTTGLLSKPA